MLTPSSFFKTPLQSVPKPVRSFLLRGLIIFLAWKILYLGFLAFPRTLDKPLTKWVGQHAAWVLNTLYNSNEYSAKELVAVTNFEGQIQIAPVSRIDKNGKKLLHIADGCNGLELFVLFIGFILAMPSGILRKTAYILIGILIIHVINVLRCVGLSSIVIHWKESFDFAHHYVFKILVYATIFILWTRFMKKISIKKEPANAISV